MKNGFIYHALNAHSKISRYRRQFYIPRRKLHILLPIAAFIVVHIYMYTQYLKCYNHSTDINLSLQSNMCMRMNLNVKNIRPSIAASFGGGRTANQLCEFATGYALWKEYGILNYIEARQLSILEQTFQLPVLNEDDNNSAYYVWREGKYSNETHIVLFAKSQHNKTCFNLNESCL